MLPQITKDANTNIIIEGMPKKKKRAVERHAYNSEHNAQGSDEPANSTHGWTSE
jgi:hypothetical protein